MLDAVYIETLNRIQLEYLEMPDLRLTLRQARRMWSLPQGVCDRAMALLVDRGFLVRRLTEDSCVERGRRLSGRSTGSLRTRSRTIL
jgi:hypothetical protein